MSGRCNEEHIVYDLYVEAQRSAKRGSSWHTTDCSSSDARMRTKLLTGARFANSHPSGAGSPHEPSNRAKSSGPWFPNEFSTRPDPIRRCSVPCARRTFPAPAPSKPSGRHIPVSSRRTESEAPRPRGVLSAVGWSRPRRPSGTTRKHSPRATPRAARRRRGPPLRPPPPDVAGRAAGGVPAADRAPRPHTSRARAATRTSRR